MMADGLNVKWVTEELSRSDTLALMKSIDIYVSLHRSEGFGLTLAEAMAMGKAVVASAYSGNMDFMTNENSRLVTAPVIVTDSAYGAYAKGTRWSNPIVAEAAERLNELTNITARTAVGTIASADIRQQLAFDKVGAQVNGLLSAIDASGRSFYKTLS